MVKKDELRHCAKSSLNCSNCGRDMTIFPDGGCRHIGLFKFKIFKGFKLRHRAKFRQNGSNRNRDMTIFRDDHRHS